MMCPRCGNEWDVSKTPCPRCGLLVRLPGRLGSRSTPQKASPPPAGVPANKSNEQTVKSQQAPFGSAVPSTPATHGRPSNNAPASLPTTPRPEQEFTKNPYQSQPLFPLQGQSGAFPAAKPLATPRVPTPLPPLQAPDIDKSMRATSMPWSGSSEPKMQPTSRPLGASGRLVPRNPPSRPLAPNNGFAMPGYRPPTGPMPPASSLASTNFRLPNDPMPPIPPEVSKDYKSSLDPIDFLDSTSTEIRSVDVARSPLGQHALRPKRLVTDPLAKLGDELPPSTPGLLGTMPGMQASLPVAREVEVLLPGTLLRGGRYRLEELQGRQEWMPGVSEGMWLAQDAQRSGAHVMLCELVMPESSSMMMQSMLRTATMALTSVGRHPHIPTLWDAFSDQGRNFFVFEPIEGESLLQQMRRTGRALTEQDVIECCLQMAEVLELLSQQTPPLVHGLINPEHIIVARQSGQYMLTNFSIVLAGGATQLISGLDRAPLPPYTAPELARGMVDGRADLYSLMATAYHAVTGSIPTPLYGAIPQARRLNPQVSPQFDAILAKGLRPVSTQRYQRPSDLRQELLAMRALSGGMSVLAAVAPATPLPVQSVQPSFPAPQPEASTAAQQLSGILARSTKFDLDDLEQKSVLPKPEELAPIEEKNEKWFAAIWVVAILALIVVVVLLSRGLL